MKYFDPVILVSKGCTVVHVGCYKFETAMLWSNLVGESGDVIIVEADPNAALSLSNEAAYRGVKNITVKNYAVWNESGHVSFAINEQNSRSRMSELNISTESEIKNESFVDNVKVKCETLDRIIENSAVASPDYVIFELPGGELEALEGSANILNTSKPKLRFRCSTINKDENSTNLDLVRQELEQIGYHVYSAYDVGSTTNGYVFAEY